jgi:7-cyano-7-deazaguanine reductase|tara:strand:+ start:5829 stop:6764 length:936 start_codon:yes stop_codon:yes gene_type:complete
MKIEDIASVHLGKAGDGSVVKPYITPDNIEKSLLVGIPRVLNRTQYNIKDEDLPFAGIDTWNSYEFSCLLDNGFPISGWLRWSYPANSKNIVESKSAKLYLNSFNMAKMGPDMWIAADLVEKTVREDMAEVLGLSHIRDLEVCLFIDEDIGYVSPMRGTFLPLEEILEVSEMAFNQYNEDPSIFDTIHSPHEPAKLVRYSSKSLRSNCRVTNQPDWGDVYIHIKGQKLVTPESLLQYIVSMRKENHFHEEICECIYKRLFDLLEPEELIVTCLYTRRGGIDINPIRSSSADLLFAHPISSATYMTTKTMRQ